MAAIVHSNRQSDFVTNAAGAVAQKNVFSSAADDEDNYNSKKNDVFIIPLGEHDKIVTKPLPKNEEELIVYVHPVCPFAQRAWICAYEVLGNENFVSQHVPLGEQKPKWYVDEIYEKGTVPAISVGTNFKLGDSIPVVKWILENYNAITLMERKEDKAALEEFGKKVISPCYSLLRNQDESQDVEKVNLVEEGMDWFENVLKDRGHVKFGFFEMICVPFFLRFRHTLEHWRGVSIVNITRPITKQWIRYCESQESVAKTTRPGLYYIEKYKGYAKTKRSSLSHL